MIDLHSHILPGIDDGAPDLATALEMARIATDDGIRTMACTPHVYPGVFENTAVAIGRAVNDLQKALVEAGIELRLVAGADAHLCPELPARLAGCEVPTLAGTRYFLLEPPHHVAPPRFAEFVFGVIARGYVPVVTHPERLTWIADHYDALSALADQGAWLQVTAGSLTGRFGGEARYWAERLLEEGRVHLLATDAHGVRRRAPLLAEGRDAAERWVGAEEARHLVETRPAGILENWSPSQMPALHTAAGGKRERTSGLLGRLFGRTNRR